MDKEQAKSILRKVVNPDVKEAIETLIPELNENEDERNWKAVLDCVKDDALKEWLKKQKEQKSLNISAASEWLRKHVCNYMNSEYNEFHQCVEYDGSIDKEKLVNGFEEAMQKEQKPVLMKIDNSEKNVVFPFKARVKDSDKVVTIIDGQLNFDGKQWIKFASNRDDGFKVYCPEDLLVEQSVECIEFDNEFKNQVSHLLASVLNKEWEYNKGFVEYAAQQLLGYAKHEIKSVGWSEEDEKKRKGLIKGLEDRMGFGWASDPFSREEYISWLKSLRPQPNWKPSEEQMKALNVFLCTGDFSYAGQATKLQELYIELKKL